MEDKKKKKSIWPTVLVAGIIVFVSIVSLVLFITIAVIILSVAGIKNRINSSTYSYSNTVANMNTSNKPATVTLPPGAPYDYTFVNDVLTANSTQVESWIITNYPGCSITKTDFEGTKDSWWVVTSTNPMNPVSINGVIINYNQVEFHLNEGYAREIIFTINGGDKNQFTKLYNSLAAIYGQKQVYVGEKDILTKLTDPNFEYYSYLWLGYEFDGYYDLSLRRSVHGSLSQNMVAISKDY